MEDKMFKFPTLSIIVPISRMSGRLDKIRNWLADVDAEFFQIIFVHDVQDSTTSSELQELIRANLNHSIDLIEGRFGSPGAARNAGLEIVNGEWIAFWDSDDVPVVEAFKYMVNNSNLLGFEIAVGSFEIVNDSSNLTLGSQIFEDNRNLNLEMISSKPGIWRFAFRFKNFINMEFKHYLMAEDQVFLAELEIPARSIYFDKNIVYSYYTGGNFHLTKNKSALADLVDAAESTYQIALSQAGESKIFSLDLFIRQNLTSIVRANFLTKVNSMRVLFKSFFKVDLRTKSELLSIFRRIILRRKGNKKFHIILTGGLGNQLFQLSYALANANERLILLDQTLGRPRLNVEGQAQLSSFRIPSNVRILERKNVHRLASKVFGFNLRSAINPRNFEISFVVPQLIRVASKTVFSFYFKTQISPYAHKDLGYTNYELMDKENLAIGYFQSFEWPCLKVVKDLLDKIEPKVQSEEFHAKVRLAEAEKPIFVHVRLGDYKLEDNFGTLTLSYYKVALDQLATSMDQSRIWLFSDEPLAAINLIPENFQQNLLIIPPELLSVSETFELFRYGSAYVIGNSTFSWWGAFLRKYEFAPIIAPDPWFKNMTEPTSLIPHSWLRVKSWEK
jgi:glycosyltransferase involved in cell wall biosynthesis